MEHATRLNDPYKIYGLSKSNFENPSDISILHDQIKYGMGSMAAARKIAFTKSEFKEITREARLRVLNTKRNSYGRQFSRGLILRSSARALNQAVDFALDNKELRIDIERLLVNFKKKVP